MCEKIGGVARDGKSTCMKCGGIDAYGAKGRRKNKNIQTKCLNVKCSNLVEDGNKWCTMECKKHFLFDHYSDGQTQQWFKEYNEDYKENQKEIMEKIEQSGMSISEYILGISSGKGVKNE